MSDKIKILSDPPDPKKDFYGHLRPIVDYLINERGNSPDRFPVFSGDKSGRGCRMTQRIDWQDLFKKFEFPSSITVSPQHGIIRDNKLGIDIMEGWEEDGQP